MTNLVSETNNKPIMGSNAVLVGDVGAGKSSLVLWFVKGQFVEFVLDYEVLLMWWESSIDTAFYSHTLAVNDATVKSEIWDTASFELAKKWVQELQAQGNPNTVVALAGNKGNLFDAWKVTAEEVQTHAPGHGLFFMETSAKTAANVNDIFYEIGSPSRPHWARPLIGG
ncbi:hypothetical protein ACJRO7_020602 [Eucalyptus globulus]|uniref:Uncharacterized protein n=1 Tax=Eucalyptus globulus TaxID=34317 RepID=A0ABD3KM10_EUCGL